jgi:class 3 adenylate cyclase/ATP/maltotriose-dependent transcriptional regulator MalT
MGTSPRRCRRGRAAYTSRVERKLATVLFVDLVDSTTFVSSSDPEVVRRRVTRFFDGVSHCIVSHGGIVEKFAGDAVMAAFGIPQAHEDDAERGVRAGLAILDSVQQLGLEARVGIESGEVVADDTESTFATGEAVNVAARLQQAAGAGEVLIGPTTYRLTLGRVVVEDKGLIELRGLADPLPAWQALEVGDQPGRAISVTGPFVGRDAELDLLENTFARAMRDERAHLFTIYGEPGVGKSRLAREFLAGVEGATILAGRCLPYGEGITYWPLAEMVKVAAGISDDDPVQEATEKLRAACGDDAVADLLGLASGVLELVEGERSGQEISWAAREWASELADAQPLILVFEDIHWAEEPLLELIEHLAERVREAPLLILCLARPELLDVRPGWGGGRLRATAIELEPLAPEESEELVEALLEEVELAETVRRTLLDKTEGNPLFVEETIRMLVEQPSDDTAAERIPDTIQALIAARIDRLPRNEKAVLQRAAVIGRIFWPGAVAHLSPDVEEIEPVLDNLLLRDFLVEESRSTITGEQAYRFKHVLIRDVAFAGLSKGARADLHAGFAEWLHERAGEELLEIRAYHLDHAATLLAELDGAVQPELAAEAAAALEAAGRRALQREANRAARRLLRRSVDLEPTLERRFHAARAAWRLGELPTVASEMEAVRASAAEAGNKSIEGRALTALADIALLRDADLPRGREAVERALVLLEDAGPEARFDALEQRARIGWWLGDLDDYQTYVKKALAVAQDAERVDLEANAYGDLAYAALSRLDVEEGERLAGQALELADSSGNRVARGWALVARGRADRARNRLDLAEAAFLEAADVFSESGASWALARVTDSLAWLAWQRGDLMLADRRFREAIRVLQPTEDRGALCEIQRGLAQLLVDRGQIEEAERWALESRKTVGPHDMASRASTRLALGIVRAAQGRDEEAETLLLEAVEIARPTQITGQKIALLETVAGFFRERGRLEEAAAYEEEAAALRPDSVLA